MREQTLDTPFRTLIASLLVGGTALGAAMLALPVASAGGGLIPSWTIYLLCWLFGIFTGLLFVEICTWLPVKANIVTMASMILGPWGKIAVWILYLFLFYSLTIAYVAGGGHFVQQFFGGSCPQGVGSILFTFFFAIFIFLGTRVSGRLNAVLMVGLIVTYVLFVSIGSTYITVDPIGTGSWWSALLGLPIIFTAFSYQGTIPSLFEYLGRDPKKMRTAIYCGTSIPFVAYLIWDFIIKGIVPIHGPHGLLDAKIAGLTAVDPLQYFLPGSNITIIANFFAFFALTTSFIGVTIGLLDFLADGLRVKKEKWGKLGLCCLIFIPPVIITMINPSIFVRALGFGGGFGCVLLLGLMPTLMVWKGRYGKKYSAPHQLMGGKLFLGALLLCTFFEIVIEIISEVI